MRKFGVSEEEYEEFNEDTKAELFDGTLIIHLSASIRHEDIFGFLYFLMRGYAEHKRLGKGLGKVLGSRATMHLGPCMLEYFICEGREAEHFERGAFRGRRRPRC